VRTALRGVREDNVEECLPSTHVTGRNSQLPISPPFTSYINSTPCRRRKPSDQPTRYAVGKINIYVHEKCRQFVVG